MVKKIVNVHTDGYKNTGEMVLTAVSSSDNMAINMEERLFLGSDLNIYTGSGATGVLLTLDSDYTLGKRNEELSTIVDSDVYGAIYITNVVYQNIDLYIPDDTLTLYGDYIDASDINDVGELIPVDISDGETFTPSYGRVQLIADTSLLDAAITIGDGAFLGQELTLSNQGTGFATYTHPDFSYGIIVDSDHDPVIKWVSDGVGGFKWDVGSSVTAEYVSGRFIVELTSTKKMVLLVIDNVIFSSAVSATLSLSFPLNFSVADYLKLSQLEDLVGGKSCIVRSYSSISTSGVGVDVRTVDGSSTTGSGDIHNRFEGEYA